jgi:hypothetical protein
MLLPFARNIPDRKDTPVDVRNSNLAELELVAKKLREMWRPS